MAATFADVLSSTDTLINTFAAIEPPAAAGDDYELTATVEPQSNVVRISIEGPEEAVVAALSLAVRPLVESLVIDIYDVFQARFLTPADGGLEASGHRRVLPSSLRSSSGW
ncbi:MAG: hypothetical protein R2849_19380 [Thermomicrobiales bacterium]